VEIEKPWAEKHWRSLELAYRRAPFFDSLAPLVKAWYELADKQKLLTDVNEIFMRGIGGLLGLTTCTTRDTAYPAAGIKTARLLSIAMAAGADHYLSGPSARAYFDESMFRSAGISTEWMSYEGYPEYPQLHGGFEHAVTVLDLLFNTGAEANRYLARRD
jgi:WbqC-like protein family